MWRALRSESAQEISSHLLQLFAEFGPPDSVMSDNGTVFQSREIMRLLHQWEVSQVFSCAYRPKGNGIVERVHRTIKRTVKRTSGSVLEAVFWLNNTRGIRGASPYEFVFCARSRKPGVSAARVEVERPCGPSKTVDVTNSYNDCSRNPFVVGDLVYRRPPDGRCNQEWSGPHRVTAIRSSVTAVLDEDNVSRHVSHIRRVPHQGTDRQHVPSSSDDDSDDDQDLATEVDSSDDQGLVTEETRPRRSCRERRSPRWTKDFHMS